MRDAPDRRTVLVAGAMTAMPVPAAATPATGPALSSEPWLRVAVRVAPPLLFGRSEGYERRCVPLLDGTVAGRVAGTIAPGGTDWQRVYPDGTTELDAHYAIRTDAGDVIEAHGQGLRSGSEAAMRDLLAGKPVDPALIYFRVAYRFTTAAPTLRALTARLFIGIGRRALDRVEVDIYAVE